MQLTDFSLEQTQVSRKPGELWFTGNRRRNVGYVIVELWQSEARVEEVGLMNACLTPVNN